MVDAGAPDLPSPEIKNASSWMAWIQSRDREIRGRIDLGIEDSISNLILFGTGYTTLPPIARADAGADSSGGLTTACRERVHALARAMGNPGKNERVQFARDFLLKRKVAPANVETYLATNLERLIHDEREFDRKQRAAQQTGDPDDLLMTRATIYKERGLSFDTSLEPDFAFEVMLAQLKQKSEVAPGRVRRIAVIGPGLDFADKRIGLDFYPIQTIQPFAIMESVLRLGLSAPENVRVVAFDLNPAVLAHVDRLSNQGRLGRPYVVQLPNDSRNQWTPDLISYWQHFGEFLGDPTQSIGPPVNLQGVEVRAVAIRPEFASRVSGEDLNMVAQRLDQAPSDGFDLIIASNVFVYYNFFEQALAMQNISHMLNPGGVFLVNQVLSNQHPDSLKLIDQCSVSFNAKGVFGDNVVAYQQQ
jgi:SAM-dependent methyltransferase